MGRNDVVNIPDMSEEITKKIIQAVNVGIQKAEKAVKNSTVKINGMNVQVDTATQGVITDLNKQIEEINKTKDKLHNVIKEIYSYKPNGNKKYAISQSGNSYALTEDQTKAIEKMVNASKEAGNKITADEKKQIELQYRLVNAKDELIDRIKVFSSLNETAFDSGDVKQYYKDVLTLEKVMKNLFALSKETGLNLGFDTKKLDVKSLINEVQNKDWLSNKLAQGLDNEIIALQNKIQQTTQNAQQNLVTSIMNDNPLSKVQKQINDAEQAIDDASSNIEQRVNQLVKEINDSWSIINDDNASQDAYDKAEKQLEKSVTTLAKYKDLLKDNDDVNDILSNDDLNLYIDEKNFKKIKDNVIENNSAIIKSNQETITSCQEYIKNLDWADNPLGIAYGDEIVQTFKTIINSLKEENKGLKASLETTGQIANEEFDKLQQKFEASENLVKELESVVSSLELKIKDQSESLRKLEDEKRDLAKTAGTNLSPGGTGSSGSEAAIDKKELSEYLKQIQQVTNEISNKLSNELLGAVEKFKEELQSTSNISYTKMFESLRNSLRDIVNEFQTSLTNIRFDKSNALYDTLKGWNDASRYMSDYNSKSDSERAAFANLETGSISNSYVFDKNNAFSNKLLEILNKASHGIEEDISKVYDTWIHSHPVESSKRIETSKNKWENIATTGSDVGFSVADLNTWVKQGLKSGLKNMLVTNNYKYTKLDLTDVSKDKFEEFKKEFIKNLEETGVKVNSTTGDTVVPISLKGTNGQKYFDLDEKTNIINSAMTKASETVFGSNRLTTGSITDLIKDVNILSEEEQEASSNAQELFAVLDRLNGVLNSSDNMLQLGISEESLNGILSKLNDIIDAINNIGNVSKKNNELNTDLIKDDTQNTDSNIGTMGILNETEQLEALKTKIGEVTNAVDLKTRAFQEEEQVVIGTVQREISNLELLDGQLLEIISTIEKLKSTPIDIDLKFLNEENVDSNINKLISDLDEKIKNLDIESLSKLSEALKGLKVSEKSAENLEMVAIALGEFRTSLSGISSEENSFLSSINAILSKTDELKDLVKILESSTKKIKEVENAAKDRPSESNNSNKNKKPSSNKKQSEITNSINKAINKMKELQYSGSGEVFEKVFEQASQKVEEFSLKLATGEMTLEEFENKIKQIQQYVKNDKTIKFIDIDNLEKAQNIMKEIAMEESNGDAELSWAKNNQQLTATWVDQDGMVQKLVMSYDKLSGALTRTSSATKKTETQSKTLFQLFKQGWQNVKQYVMSFVGFYEIVNAVRNGITVIRDLDTALTEMRKVSDESIESLKNFQDVSFDIAQSVGTTAKQIQNSTADWMRLGESLDEAAKSAEVANILLNVSEFESIDDATESLVAMSAAYNELEKIEIVDKLNLIGNNFAISTDGLATALQKSASALKTAGNDMDEAIALVTAGNQVVQDADSVGAGLRTISLRITGTEAAKAELESLGEDTSDFIVQTSAKSQEAIKNFTKVASNNFQGFDILDDNGNFKSTYEILLGISKIYEEILETDKQYGSNMANGLLETLSGKNRANITASILQNPTILEEAYESSVNDAEGSAFKENERYLESIEGRIQLFQNRLQEFWHNLIDSEVVKEFVDAGTKLIDILDNILSGLTESGVTNIVTGFLTGTIDLIASITNGLGKLSTVLAGVLGVTIFKKIKGKDSGGRAKKFALKVIKICHRIV